MEEGEKVVPNPFSCLLLLTFCPYLPTPKFIAFPYNLWYMYMYPWDMRAHNHGHLWQLFHHPHNVSSTVVYYSVCMTSGLYVNCKVCPWTNVMIIGTQNKPMIRTNKKLTFPIRWLVWLMVYVHACCHDRCNYRTNSACWQYRVRSHIDALHACYQ